MLARVQSNFSAGSPAWHPGHAGAICLLWIDALDLALQQRAPVRHLGAVAAVAGLHVALLYALLTGMTRDVVEAAWKPIQVKLVEAIEPPPPPPAPLPNPPPPIAPVPIFAPPPEVRVAQAQAPNLTVTTTPGTVPSPSVPPSPRPAPVAVAAPAQQPPVRHPAHAAVLDVSRCERPAYPIQALREEAVGTTRIRFRVDASGHVEQAQLLRPSGVDRSHRALDRAAIEALSRCAFKPGTDEQGHSIGGIAIVDYVWNLNQ
jgi:protein TonB